jgi:hypothetical protein
MIHLLEKMQSLQLVHFNLHEDSVFYNEIQGCPVFSSFGMSFEWTQVETRFEKIFQPYENYRPWPIEIAFLAQIASRKRENPIRWKEEEWTRQEISEICNRFIQHPESIFRKHGFRQWILHAIEIDNTETTMVQSRENFANQLEEYFANKYENQSLEKMYQDLTQISIMKTWDLYSLAILLLNMEIIPKKASAVKYVDVLKTVIFSMPEARPSLKYIENTMRDIFQTPKPF